jgi:hypothetical protein
MTETQPNYKYHFRERRAMLDTALKMIEEGRFQNSAIREIAFHARLSESTALHFFPSNSLLVQELELYSVEEINRVIHAGLESSRIKKAKFLTTWRDLFQFFSRNQGLFKFIDQGTLILRDATRFARLHEGLNSRLVHFFEPIKNSFTATQSAAIFHSSVASAVKLKYDQRLDLTASNLDALALSCWMSLKQK